MSVESEFGKDYDVPYAIRKLIKSGAVDDSSWHNDSSPSVMVQEPGNDERGVRIWMQHPLEDMREMGGKRFIVQYGGIGSVADDELETHELQDALEKFFGILARPEFDGAKVRSEPWWLDDSDGKELVHEFMEYLPRSRS